MYFLPLFIFFIICSNLYCFAEENTPGSRDVIINAEIDKSLADIRNHIKRFGFEPLKVSNISDESPAFTANLTNGVIYGASTIERAGDFHATIHRPWVRLHGRVRFEKLQGVFNYSFSTKQGLALQNGGFVKVTTNNITANISVDLGLDASSLQNPQLHVEDYGSLDVLLTDDSPYNRAENIVLNTIAPFFKEIVIGVFERTTLEAIKKFVIHVNQNWQEYIGDALNRLKL